MGDTGWIWMTIAWVLVAVAAAVGAWSLFADRARGRRRCPKCWYAMDGVPGLKCPECGHAAANEKRLLRTRRRWRWVAVASLVLLMAYGAFATPRTLKHGWPGAVPTGLLVVVAPFPRVDEDAARAEWAEALDDECERRFGDGEYFGWQTHLLVWRVKAGFWAAGRLGVTEREREVYAKLETTRFAEARGLAPLEFLEKLARETGVPCRTEWDGAQDGDSPEQQTSSTYAGTRAIHVLDRDYGSLAFHSNQGLRWVIADDAVELVPSMDPAQRWTRGSVYDVRDLVSVEEFPKWASDGSCFGPWVERQTTSADFVQWTFERQLAICDILISCVTPGDWEENGGRASRVWMWAGLFFIVAPVDGQLRVERLLDAMRRSVNGAARSVDVDDLSREREAIRKTGLPPSAFAGGEMTLSAAMSLLSESSGVPIVGDWAMLDRDGIIAATPVKVPGSPGHTLASVLDATLDTATWARVPAPVWTVDGDRVVVTTRDGTGELTALVIYDVTDVIEEPAELPDDDRRPEAERVQEIVDFITYIIDREGWQDNGGDVGFIQKWDGRLVVRNTPRTQEAIRGQLEQLREAKKSAK